MELGTLAFLAAAGFTAAFVDAMVGGGGAISIPALLVAGLPPHAALGTNKLAASGSSFTATVQYARHGTLVPRLCVLLTPLAALGAALGVEAVLALDPSVVEGLVVVLMAGMTIYVLARRRFGEEDTYEEPGLLVLGAASLGAFLVGAYDGFLGPGSGSFFLFLLVGVLGFDFVRAAGHGRVLNLGANVASLAYFWISGEVLVLEGLTMGAGMLAGAWTGARAGIEHGAAWIKPLFVAITLVMMARLLGLFSIAAGRLGL
jgi:uncharacterized membrane protein YfcA